MDDDRENFREARRYRAAARRFQSAFEAAEQLAEPERQVLLEQVANWLLQHMPNVPLEEPKTTEVVGIQISQAGDQPNGQDDDPPEGA